jgi:hypothetical protein
MRKIQLLTLLGITVLSASLYGQDTLPISKNQLLTQVAQKNLQVALNSYEFNRANLFRGKIKVKPWHHVIAGVGKPHDRIIS